MNIYAKRLNEDMPRSEVWFHDKFKSHLLYGHFKSNVVVGKYIVDLLDSRNRIAIEVDGSIHDNEIQRFKDFVKDKYLTDKRYTVIRVVAYDEESYNNCINKLELIFKEKVS
jgi:very-short-patch-repair endonuclease